MDADAFHEAIDEASFVNKVRRLAHGYARRLTSDDVADDIAQDVALWCLMLLRKNRWRFELKPQGIIKSMTRRAYAKRRRDDARRRSREAQYATERTAVTPEWMNPARGSEEQEESWLHERAFEELPPDCRSTFLLVREHGMTYREAARREGISPGMVSKRVARVEGFLVARLLRAPRWRGMPPIMERRSGARERTTRR